MKQTQNTLWLVAGGAVLLSLVVGAIAGALAGGLSGYLLGRGQAQPAMEARLGELETALRETRAQLDRVRGAMEEMRLQMEEGVPYPYMPWEELPPEDWPEMPQPWEGMPFHPWEDVNGALVTEVLPGTAAAAAGLQPGDFIIVVDGRPVSTEQQLPDILLSYRPGDKVALTVLRGEGELRIEVQLGRHPDDPARPYLGVQVMHMGPQQNWER